MKGKIKWFNPKKGYGFIVGEDGKDIFVHKNDMPAGANLNDQDPVEYEIEETERGPQAKKVKKIEETESVPQAKKVEKIEETESVPKAKKVKKVKKL